MSRRKSRAGGGSTNRSNDASREGPSPADSQGVPRTKSLPLGTYPDGDPVGSSAGRPLHTPPKTLGDSFQESATHHSWRGFPRKAKTGKSSGPGLVSPVPLSGAAFHERGGFVCVYARVVWVGCTRLPTFFLCMYHPKGLQGLGRTAARETLSSRLLVSIVQVLPFIVGCKSR